jgi:nitrogen-specific signal transduction histidine kinase
MSDINIKGAVKNIKSMTNVYTPIVEVVVNAIQAIESKNEKNGKIIILVKRAQQISTDDTLSDIESFEIKDNGSYSQMLCMSA